MLPGNFLFQPSHLLEKFVEMDTLVSMTSTSALSPCADLQILEIPATKDQGSNFTPQEACLGACICTWRLWPPSLGYNLSSAVAVYCHQVSFNRVLSQKRENRYPPALNQLSCLLTLPVVTFVHKWVAAAAPGPPMSLRPLSQRLGTPSSFLLTLGTPWLEDNPSTDTPQPPTLLQNWS